MYGAILGDMIGAPFEFDRGHKAKDFELFGEGVEFTDDSVMTVAVAEALMKSKDKSDDEVKRAVARSMRKWGRRYPDAGYGGRFSGWLRDRNPKPYGSYGNGSAMRVSAAGWLYDTIEETRHKARLTAEVTHNHPEGIKGAEATASAIYMSRTGSTKEEIRDYVKREFGYDLSRTCDEIRPSYHHVESCQETVPEAITAFLEGEDFEDVIRTAVSLGGDSDTLTCIAGSIAEAFYGIPEDMITECRNRLPEDMLKVVDAFEKELVEASKFHDPFLVGNENIEQAIKNYNAESTGENLQVVLVVIRQRMHEDGHLMIPVSSSKSGEEFVFKMVQADDGNTWPAAFTTPNEYRKGEPSEILSHYISELLKSCLRMNCPGIMLNPWGESFTLTKEMMEAIIRADEGVEYSVPEESITPELLEGGAYLKRAVEICKRNWTVMNSIKLLKILRNSYVWIPCEAVVSDTLQDTIANAIEIAEKTGNNEALKAVDLTGTRMIPNIFSRDDGSYFPVFTTTEETGEYGESVSKMERHFLEAVCLARNNKKDVKGIVINAFTDSLVLTLDLCEVIKEIKEV